MNFNEQLQKITPETPEERNVFESYKQVSGLDDLQEWLSKGKKIIVDNITQTEEIFEARKARLELKRIRNAIENKRKDLKEGVVREGKAIDGMANIFKSLIIPVEKHLEDQEKFVEIQEQKRIKCLGDSRRDALSRYIADTSFYDLGNMNQQGFDQLLESSCIAYENQKEAERKAEEERKRAEEAAAKEREQIKKENEKLKAEQEKQRLEQEKKDQIEIKRRAAEEKKIADERKKRKAVEDKIKQIEQEKKQKKEAEEKAIKEAKEKLLKASDKERMTELAKRILDIEYPEVRSKESEQIIKKVNELLTEAIKLLKKY